MADYAIINWQIKRDCWVKPVNFNFYATTDPSSECPVIFSDGGSGSVSYFLRGQGYTSHTIHTNKRYNTPQRGSPFQELLSHTTMKLFFYQIVAFAALFALSARLVS